jgi:exosome complex component CSL4
MVKLHIYGKDQLNTYQPCSLTGLIKRENIRSYDIEKIRIEQCFRPGDVIRALVLSTLESHNLYLSTSEEECGVMYAKCSTCKMPMMPINWHLMKCMKCNLFEERKVSKPTE